jgi:hypothetical protein
MDVQMPRPTQDTWIHTFHPAFPPFDLELRIWRQFVSRKVGFPHFESTNPRFALMYFMVDFGSCCFFACSSIWIRQRHLALLWNVTKGLTVRGCHDDCPWWFRSVVMDLLNVDRFAARACLCIQVLEDLKSLEKLLPQQKRQDTAFCHELLAFPRPHREMAFHPCMPQNQSFLWFMWGRVNT